MGSWDIGHGWPSRLVILYNQITTTRPGCLIGPCTLLDNGVIETCVFTVFCSLLTVFLQRFFFCGKSTPSVYNCFNVPQLSIWHGSAGRALYF